jgi:hypothetical protein
MKTNSTSLFVSGYLAGTRLGAHVHNLVHTTTLPH